MENISQILAKLANHESWEGYDLLRLAILEAARTQPISPSMNQLCAALAETTGKQNPKTIYRSMARAVDDIWARPENRPLLKKYYRREVVEKPTLDGFISALAWYLRETSSGQADEDSCYQITYDFDSRKYGVLIRMEETKIWASFPNISPDLERVERIIAFLCRKKVSLSEFKDFYLSGGLQSDPLREREHI